MSSRWVGSMREGMENCMGPCVGRKMARGSSSFRFLQEFRVAFVRPRSVAPTVLIRRVGLEPAEAPDASLGEPLCGTATPARSL